MMRRADLFSANSIHHTKDTYKWPVDEARYGALFYVHAAQAIMSQVKSPLDRIDAHHTAEVYSQYIDLLDRLEGELCAVKLNGTHRKHPELVKSLIGQKSEMIFGALSLRNYLLTDGARAFIQPEDLRFDSIGRLSRDMLLTHADRPGCEWYVQIKTNSLTKYGRREYDPRVRVVGVNNEILPPGSVASIVPVLHADLHGELDRDGGIILDQAMCNFREKTQDILNQPHSNQSLNEYLAELTGHDARTAEVAISAGLI